jgi:phosphoribosylamine--glycine ligase
VVMAAGGYPLSYSKGDKITGLETPVGAHQKSFHAGTAMNNGDIVTNGGRVLCATALGNSVSEAQAEAYALVKQIQWDKVYFRSDIAYRAIARENSQGATE